MNSLLLTSRRLRFWTKLNDLHLFFGEVDLLATQDFTSHLVASIVSPYQISGQLSINPPI